MNAVAAPKTTNVVAIKPQKALSHLQVNSFPAKGNENEQLRELCSLILDNWRNVSALHRDIASTLYEKHRPAEVMSSRQLFRIAEAATLLGLIEDFSGEPK